MIIKVYQSQIAFYWRFYFSWLQLIRRNSSIKKKYVILAIKMCGL